ncbi:MAG: SIS domain-containing protein [Spirochaetaceae bacterium]|jgi:D-sedoheptulose 7-phosphate isomerase|nr:SIS domain-containing protein [Spirochaetaceae bacterium]
MDYILNLITRYPALECVKDDVKLAVDSLYERVVRDEAKILICGNGGSAADAGHIAGELNKGFLKKRAIVGTGSNARQTEDCLRMQKVPPEIRDALQSRLQYGIPALSLCEMSAALSATINDNGADFMYAQLVQSLGHEGDFFIGISTSGNAKNVLYAAWTAYSKNLTTIALTGKDGGALARMCDIAIKVPETETYKIQELHLPVYHAICAELEERIFSR